MEAGFATVSEHSGVVVTSAEVSGLVLAELRFPPDHLQPAFEPELPYLALVLDGGLEKSFSRRTMALEASSAVTMPVGARHGARFACRGARIVIVKPTCASSAAGGCLDRLLELRGRALGWLAWRLSAELSASDAAAPLAAHGIALELLAATSREATSVRRLGRPPAWLRAAEEMLQARVCDRVGLRELAEAVGVHPTHLARAFRARHGVSVGTYARRLRLAWAAAEVARSDAPLAVIATQAGFADQSHFTRLFVQHVGTTPARYRAEAHARHVPT